MMGTMTHDHEHAHHDEPDDEGAAIFEQPAWEERYAGEGSVWSGRPNAQLVAEVPALSPGAADADRGVRRALDVGCGEGGDVIWLAQQGWEVTGADFSHAGLARAASHAAEAGVAGSIAWWQVDARDFDIADDPTGRAPYDLVTSHFLHPPGGMMAEIAGRLAGAVAVGGHLLLVGHAPMPGFSHGPRLQREALWHAADVVAGLPDGFEVLVAEDRPRTMVRDCETVEAADATVLARRTR